jgi:hypothetical protein
MKRNVRWGVWAIVVLGLLGVSTAAQATSLPAGSTVSVSSAAPFTAGTLLSDTGSLAFSVGGTTGTVREWVVSNASSALCAGCLSFIYQVQVTQAPAPPGSSGVGRFAGSAYDAFTVDVTHISDAVAALTGSVAGGFGANNADRDASGNTVGFNYTSAGGIFTGASFLEMANTNATALQTGLITVTSTTSASQNFTGFAPGTSAVPEPATALLLGSSLVALVLRRRSQHFE